MQRPYPLSSREVLAQATVIEVIPTGTGFTGWAGQCVPRKTARYRVSGWMSLQP